MVASSAQPVYDALQVRLNRHWLRVRDDMEHGVLVFPPAEIDNVSQALFSNLKGGGFATFVVSGRRGWDPQSFYFEAARLAAQRGCKIVRAFLLPHKQYLREESLRSHWYLDTKSGIDVKLLYVGDILGSLVIPPFSLDFGVWDEQIVCSAALNDNERDRYPAEWRITSRRQDVELAISLRDELLSRASLLPAPGAEPELLDLEEPMVQTAPLMDLLSNAVCAGSYVESDDCSWYHSVWQYLRIFDMVSTPTWHADFYIPQLKRIADEIPQARILISGTADYSTLAHVLWAFDSVKRPCYVAVLDLCQTPLIMCQWYARRTRHSIETVQADILTFEPPESYDIIVTDAFLTRFSREERSRVIQRWAHLLKPGGYVVTTVRINSHTSTEAVLTTAEQVSAFRSRALDHARRWHDFLPISPEEVAVKAQRYAERITSHPVRSEQELRSEFLREGFTVSSFTLVEVRGEMVPTTYAEVVAKKTC